MRFLGSFLNNEKGSSLPMILVFAGVVGVVAAAGAAVALSGQHQYEQLLANTELTEFKQTIRRAMGSQARCSDFFGTGIVVDSAAETEAVSLDFIDNQKQSCNYLDQLAAQEQTLGGQGGSTTTCDNNSGFYPANARFGQTWAINDMRLGAAQVAASGSGFPEVRTLSVTLKRASGVGHGREVSLSYNVYYNTTVNAYGQTVINECVGTSPEDVAEMCEMSGGLFDEVNETCDMVVASCQKFGGIFSGGSCNLRPVMCHAIGGQVVNINDSIRCDLCGVMGYGVLTAGGCSSLPL